jgi:ferric-dicitrate binding protein FerR (iron transport regulator)
MAKDKPKLGTHILEQASSWFIDLREGDAEPAARDKFNDWLRRSPEHVRAFLEISAFWEDAPSLDPGWNATADELIAQARGDENIVPLDTPLSRASEYAVRHLLTTEWRGSAEPRGSTEWGY